MVLGDLRGLRGSVRIDGGDQQDATHALGDRSVECLAHRLGVQLEVVVWHADEIDQGIDAARRGANRGRIVRVPGDDLGAGSLLKLFSQSRTIAADDAILFTTLLAMLRRGCGRSLRPLRTGQSLP